MIIKDILRILSLKGQNHVKDGIRAANCAAFSNGAMVASLPDAINRLGYAMLRGIAMNMAMSRLFQARSPFINQQLKELLAHSREVAANSYVLAQQQSHLRPEHALLAGLVHGIGALPLCICADHHYARLEQTTLQYLLRKYTAPAGTRLLQSWNFSEELIEVVIHHENLQRHGVSALPDYVDVVSMAKLQIPGTAKFIAWDEIPAVGRLGYDFIDCQTFLSTNADQLAAILGMLETGAVHN